MTPHEHEILHLALACLALAAFLLGRYHWPHLPGLAQLLDDRYEDGRDDQRKWDSEIIGRLEMELDWWERGGGAHDALHPVYEVLSPAALDAAQGPPLRDDDQGWESGADRGHSAPAGDRSLESGSLSPRLNGTTPASPTAGRATNLLDWDAIRGHMTPLDVLKIEGWEIDRRWEERQAAVLAECRAAWDLAKVAA